jgi:restriction system protein
VGKLPAIAFPVLLKDILLRKAITPKQLSSKTDIPEQTIVSFLNGDYVPYPSHALQIAEYLGGHHRELLESSLCWHSYRVRQQSPHLPPFNWRSELESLLHSDDRPHLIPDQFLPLVLEMWREADSEPIQLTELLVEQPRHDIIVLPWPPIYVLNGWSQIASEIADDEHRIYELGWREFEDLIAHLLESFGWSVTHMGYTKDEGIDLVAAKIVEPDVTFQMMVQCKRYSRHRKVGVEIVREIWSVKWEKGFHQAMIATTSFFTKGAKEKAEKWNLELKDHDAIFDWCRANGKYRF